MKYHILHEFRASTPFKEKLSDNFKTLHELNLVTKFDLSLTLLPRGVTNEMFSN